jgi:outer membrane protein assembly factor BamB
MIRFPDRRSLWLVAAAALVALAAVPAIAAPRTQAVHGVVLAPAAQASPVTTYHNDLTRSGQYVAANLTLKNAARMHIDAGFSGAVNGAVYAQPLYWRAPNASDGNVIVATETNHVTSLDASTGKVVWDRILAAPVQGGTLPCGNIAPEGITGTPVIDPSTGSLYVAATALSSGNVVSVVYGLSLKTGHTLPGWPVNLGASLSKIGFSPLAQGQRGALALQNGVLYIPYGGRYGDCDNYHGTVVGIGVASHAVMGAWQTLAVRGGIWSVGGVTIADGALFVATGNTSGATTWSGGEAIIRLDPALKSPSTPANYFTPSNWLDLDNADLDLGGSNPMLLDVGGRQLVLALGKDGNAYLADRTHLGGVGGELAKLDVSTGEIIGGPASWPEPAGMFVAFQGNGSAHKCGSNNGLTVLRISGGAKPSIATRWCAALSGGGDPIVTTTNGTANRIVWAVGAEGDDRLHGYAATTGAVIYAGGGSSDGMQNVRHMSTILAAQGRFYIPSDDRIYAFSPR